MNPFLPHCFGHGVYYSNSNLGYDGIQDPTHSGQALHLTKYTNYEDGIYEVYTARVETNSFWTSKMVQQIKELAAKLKDLNLIPGTHVVGENQLL